MTEKKWIYQEQPSEEAIAALTTAINVNPTLAGILLQRGISSFEEAKHYFRPEIDYLHDPFQMLGMEAAVNRLISAIDKEESVLIYGDYDVDGTTSVAMLFGFLSNFHKNIDFYVPDRYREGYGISKQGVDYAEKNGITLIISLDCGIRAVDKVQYAKEKGIDFIICDHHLPGEKLPDAVAILDPKQTDCPYPYKELSGCGVGFKLIQAFCQRREIPEHRAFSFLDLVAVSIAADIVPLTGENRVLAYYGLEIVNHNPRPGIKALLETAAVSGKITISNLVFQVGPRINAAGRIDHARFAVELLTAKNEEEAQIIAKTINDKNNRRREFDQSITEAALAKIESDELLQRAKSTVLFDNQWHKGVIGIVASRCIEHFHRPTIILTESNGVATGSARSVGSFDIHKAIEDCQEHLIQFGGHTHAAGLTLSLDKIDDFIEAFEKTVAEKIVEDDLIPKVNIDACIELDQISEKFYAILIQMDPYGPGNMQPVFASEDVMLMGEPKILKDKHLKLEVKNRDGNKTFTALGFGLSHFKEDLLNAESFKLAFTIEENHFRGNKSLQLYVKDIQFE